MIKLFMLLSLLISGNVLASDICKFSNKIYFNTKIQTGQFANSKRCYVMISPTHNRNLVYRNHIFTNIGEHMIFNSFGHGPISTHTGARVLRYFPQKDVLNISLSKATIDIQLPNEAHIIFDAKNSTIMNSVGMEIQEEPSINRTNQGGLVVHSSEYLYLDFGFSLGQSPTNDLGASFDIHFPDRLCSAENSQVLVRDRNEVRWRYQDNNSLIRKLTALCP